jgi:hypothetical protein
MGENGTHGAELGAMLGRLPALMDELMKEFIEKKDLTARSQIRLRMKALLDFAHVDTTYPPNPAMKSISVPNPARDMMMADQNQSPVTPTIGGPGLFVGGGVGYAVQPVPGAERADDNSAIL